MTEMNVFFVGFFNMWGFGRVNKQASQPVKKQEENITTCSLELIGDLIGHSSSVEVLPVGMQAWPLLLVRVSCSFLIQLLYIRPPHSQLQAFARQEYRIR